MAVRAGQIRKVETTRIYALVAPDGEARYVGKTTAPLWHRLSSHKTKARRSPNTYVSKWVRSLLDARSEPTIVLLEEVEGDWATSERYWIRQLRLFGCRLANSSDGGEGGAAGWVAPPETRERMSEAAKVRCLDPAERVRLGAISNRKPPVGRGEENNFSKFEESQVLEMRERRAAGESCGSIAVDFGTSKGVVAQIVRGESWAHVGGPLQRRKSRTRLTEEDIAEMRRLVQGGVRQSEVARRFGVDPSHVSKTVSGQRRAPLHKEVLQ
jgi:hypothetical protein